MGKSYIDKDRAAFNLEYIKFKHLVWCDPEFRSFMNTSWNPWSTKTYNRFLLHANRRNREVSLFKVIRLDIKEKITTQDMKDQLEEYYNDLH